MADTKKRKPIRRQLQQLVLLFTMLSLFLLTLTGLVGMARFRVRGKEVMTDQMTRNLLAIIKDKSELAEHSLAVYERQVTLFADFASSIYEHPEHHVKNEVLPPLHTTPQGAYSMTRAFTDATIDPEAPEIKEELEMLGAMEEIFAPVTKVNNGRVSTAYLGTETGILVSYDAYAYDVATENDDELIYDFFSTDWYKKGTQSSGYFWTDVYQDGFGRGLNLTCASPVFTGRGEFRGVVAEDIMITDLYDTLTRLTLGEGAYVVLIDSKGNIISPDVMEETIYDTDLTEEEIREVMSGETGIFLSDEEVYHAYTPIESVGWTLMIHVPQSLVYSPLGTMERIIHIMTALFIAISIVILILVITISGTVSKRVTEPVTELIEDVKKMKEGDLGHRAVICQNDEVGDLAVGFNEMAESLQEQFDNISSMTAERERLATEMDVAARIQADTLPTTFPAFPDRGEFDIFAYMLPAKEVGGDYYDFFLIDEDHLAIEIADVVGKGVPAALFSVIVKTLVKNRTMMGGTPAEIFKDINEQLCKESEEEVFVTVWLGILTISTGEMICANAGHEYPVFKQGGALYEFVRDEHDPPLATMHGIQYVDHRMLLEPGAALYLYTDGVSEAKDVDGKRFGMNRIAAALNVAPEASPKEQIEHIREELRGFVDAADPYDDVTMLSFVYRGQGGKA